ncbi:MAG: hypothetical protein WBF53_03130 [Litorimonas sp.]
MVSSYANIADGPWLGEQAARLGLRVQFDRGSDPLTERADSEPKDTQGKTRKADKPEPALKPPPHMRRGIAQLPVKITENTSEQHGLKAQRDAAFSNIPSPYQGSNDLSNERSTHLRDAYNRIALTPTR